MKSSGVSTTKHLLCPICEKDHGCKINEDGSVLCLRITSPNDAPTGYRFIQTLNNDMGGLFVVGRDDTYSSWQDEIERRNRLRQQKKEKTRKQSLVLSLEERDRQYRNVLSQLSVSEEHKRLLLDRGLTQVQIEQAGFKTWVPIKGVTGATSSLSGIDQRGDRLVGCKGIAIPAYSPLKQITGFQIKTDSGRPGKYVWLSSARKDGSGGNGPQLPNGELPLFVWMPEGVSAEEIWLCEGGLKSAIAAYKLNKVVIGAAGGQFTTDTLQNYLKILKPSRVVLAPDAGAINNTAQIPAANYKVIKLCQAWGCEVKVAWWDQKRETKDLDIDELLVAGRGGEIQFISPEAFFNLHPISIREKLEKHTPQRAGLIRSDFPVLSPHEFQNTHSVTEYQAGDRQKILEELVKQGGVFQESSGMGLGKSHTAGLLEPENVDVEQIIYITNNPRNVTTETLKGWPVNQGRHRGLVVLPGPNGTEQIRNAKEGEHPTILPNCDRSEEAHLLSARNIPAVGSKICPGCPYLEDCRKGAGPYVYLADRVETISQPRYVSHIDSLDPKTFAGYSPNPDKKPHQRKTLLVLEEASQQKLYKSFTVRLADLERTRSDLKANHPDEAEKLEPTIEAIKQGLLGKLPRYGLDHLEVLKILPKELPDLTVEEMELISAQESKFFEPDYVAEEHGFSSDTKLSDLPREARKAAKPNSQQLMKQTEALITLRWLPDFWKALHGEGVLRLTTSGLEIKLPDQRRLEILTSPAVKAIILLDATEPSENFEQWLKKPVVTVREKPPDQVAEVEFIQINDLGMMGFSRGKDQQRRARILEDEIKKQYPDALVINTQEYAQEGDGYWFLHSRGSNAFQETSTLILVGCPIPNIGALTDEFALMTERHPSTDIVPRSYPINAKNTKPGGPWWVRTLNESADLELAAFIRRRILAEIDQGAERLRANRRPGGKLRVFFLSDYPLDREVTFVSSEEVVPQTASKKKGISAADVERATQQLERRGKKVTEEAIAKKLGVSRSTVNRAKKVHGEQFQVESVQNPCLEGDREWFVDAHDAINNSNSTLNIYKPPANALQEGVSSSESEETHSPRSSLPAPEVKVLPSPSTKPPTTIRVGDIVKRHSDGALFRVKDVGGGSAWVKWLDQSVALIDITIPLSELGPVDNF
ncbi:MULTISPECIES: hypothetical protein [Trichocoleus]|uniref:Uncharacterized protein n=1 Tax=Trichocoleus desertorum GB2-A4 TaxID=2933944 RepID=A0ABV0JF96_9CYAN|nr:hypothetical protein [Trichocoleus sp. FACHB-46]MBD1862347.1 hypothetical protein [Trichocoleus sp. FACHB-46]